MTSRGIRKPARRTPPPAPAAKAPARLPLARGGSRGLSTEAVHERIWNAIVEHSLPPETRLVESELCDIFGLGRTRLRQVLQQLAHEHVVTLQRNRGATVARPTPGEAREVFAARRILEGGIVQTLLGRSARQGLRRLHEHLLLEEDAWRTGDRRAMLKLSGEFHLRIAELAGNAILLGLLRDLISRSSLIIAVYQSPTMRPCPPDAHRELIGLLEQGSPAAVDAMVHHIDHVVADLRLEDRRASGIDLRTIFTRSEHVP